MELKDIDIHELLPQQEPFVMVDTLTFFDEKKRQQRLLLEKIISL